MLTIAANYTNEVSIFLTKEKTQAPETEAEVKIALVDNMTIVENSEATMTHQGAGEYYTKYPLLELAKSRGYILRVNVKVGGNIVIQDEEYDVKTL